MQKENLWNILKSAKSEGNSAFFEKLCTENIETIEQAFQEWRRVPEDIRTNETELHAYGQTLISIATFFSETLKRSVPLDILTGKNEKTPFDEFNKLIDEVDQLTAQSNEEKNLEAIKKINLFLENLEAVKGNAVEYMTAVCYGRLGSCYYCLREIKEALQYNNYALSTCYQYGDIEGALNYISNIYLIYKEEHQPKEAEEWAIGAFNFALKNSQISEILIWELRVAELQIASNLPQAKLTLASTFNKIVDIQRDDVSAISKVLNNCAEALRTIGQFQEAEPLYLRAVQLRREAGLRDEILGQFLHNLGYLCLQAETYDKAKPAIEEAIKIFKECLPPDDQRIGMAMGNLAAYHQFIGELNEARQIYNESINQKRSSPSFDIKNLQVSIANLAELEFDAGRDFAAKAMLDQIEHHKNDSSIIKNNTYRQIMIHTRLGNYEKAETMIYDLITSMRSANDTREELLRVELELALVKSELKNYDEAERIYLNAIKQLRGTGNWLPEDLATALNNLGLMYLEVYKYEAAEMLLNEAMELRKKNLTEEHITYLDTLNNLGLLYSHTNRREKAEAIHRKILTIQRKILHESHPKIAQSLFNLSMALLEKGDFTGALDMMEEQFNLEDTALEEIFSVSSEHERLTYVAKIRRHLDVYILMMINKLKDNARAVNLAFDVVLQRKGIVINALKSDYRRGYNDAQGQALPIIVEINEIRAQIAKAILGGHDDQEVNNPLSIEDLRRKRNQLETRLARELGFNKTITPVKKIDRYHIAAQLDQDSVLIEFLQWELRGSGISKNLQKDQSAYSAFILLGGEPESVQLVHFGLADSSEDQLGLDEAIESYRNALNYPDLTEANQQVQRLGASLRRMLIDTVMPLLKDRKRLFIAPDGLLNILPFESLPLDESGYVSDNISISYLSSGRELQQRSQKAESIPGRPVVVADPAFDLITTMINETGRQKMNIQFKQLPDAREEGEWIANNIDGTLYQGEQALESIIKKLTSPRILHFATHGFFLDEQLPDPMLKSGIALAGANDWIFGRSLPDVVEDGMLMADDVCSMNLWGTELVVLSACESGLGDYKSGEGIFGLRRAFELAGARALVMSLWKVPSEPTKLLMKEFYRQLLSGKDKVESLHAAKTILRRRYSDTVYWAGFVLSGDPEAIY